MARSALSSADASQGEEEGSSHADPFSPVEGPVEVACRFLSGGLILFTVAMIGFDVISRSLFSFSIQVTNEVGAYLLLALTFLSLSTCQVRHAFHRFRLLDAKLGLTTQALLQLAFNVICTACVILVVWQFTRFEFASWKSGEIAPTTLMTPLWVPRIAMLAGMLAMLVSMFRTIAGDLRRIRAVVAP